MVPALSWIECPNCGAEFTALLRGRAPDTPPHCIECDALLPPTIAGRYVHEIFPTWEGGPIGGFNDGVRQ